jgi:glycosyltransferase involved in cell wall biosynthesis
MRPRPFVIPADVRFPLERANGVQVVKMAAALARSGIPTTLVVRQSDPRPSAEILARYGLEPEAGLEIRRLGVLHRRGSYVVPRISFLLRATALSWVRSLRGAVVYTRDLQLADLLLRLRPGPLVYEAHAVEALMYGERGALYGTDEGPSPRKAARLEAREGRVWRRAAALVTTTTGIRDSFAQSHGERDHVRVIPNGCDPPDSQEFPGLAEGAPARVLYAGQLYPWKGVDVLVEAMARIPDARLVILGGFEGERDMARVRSLVDARGLASRTDMLGTVPQSRVAEELKAARVVAVPFLRSCMTERHTSPIKAFEAMAAGRPIVASDLPSTREILRNGDDALLVPPGDVEALAGAIGRLLADTALALRLARSAFAQAPRYSWDSRARQLRQLVEELP